MRGVSGPGRHLAVTFRVVWAVLRNPALRRVELAYLLFSAALFGSYIAILVYAYEASGPGAVGVVALVLLLPSAIVAPFAARRPRFRIGIQPYQPAAEERLGFGELDQAAGQGDAGGDA